MSYNIVTLTLSVIVGLCGLAVGYYYIMPNGHGTEVVPESPHANLARGSLYSSGNMRGKSETTTQKEKYTLATITEHLVELNVKLDLIMDKINQLETTVVAHINKPTAPPLVYDGGKSIVQKSVSRPGGKYL